MESQRNNNYSMNQNSYTRGRQNMKAIIDNGPHEYVFNLRQVALQNTNYRTAVWTGDHLQVTVMNILPGEDIGFEIHETLDQMLYVVQGRGLTVIADENKVITLEQSVNQNDTIMIPSKRYHNIYNVGRTPLKLFSVYAPPQHPSGTIHITKADDVH